MLPDTPATVFQYNRESQLTEIDQSGFADTVQFLYDSAGRVQILTYEGAHTRIPSYDASGQVGGIADSSGVDLAFSYQGDFLDFQSWTGAISGSVDVTFDADGRVDSRTVSAGTTPPDSKTFRYDEDGLLGDGNSSTGDAGDLVVTRNAVTGLIETLTLGDVETVLSFNAFGELATQTTTRVSTSRPPRQRTGTRLWFPFRAVRFATRRTLTSRPVHPESESTPGEAVRRRSVA